MWSSTSSDCARAMTSSSLAKPMRFQEPRHESVWVEGQRNGCRYEKEQASHNLTAIQHHWLPVSVWYLPKIIKHTVRGQGSLTYYPYPYTGGNYQGSWWSTTLKSVDWQLFGSWLPSGEFTTLCQFGGCAKESNIGFQAHYIPALPASTSSAFTNFHLHSDGTEGQKFFKEGTHEVGGLEGMSYCQCDCYCGTDIYSRYSIVVHVCPHCGDHPIAHHPPSPSVHHPS